MSGGRDKLHFGVASGIVTDNKHPDGYYQVKLKFPWIRSTDCGDKEDFISNWARVSTPMAGGGRGFVCLPEVGDEVLVVFEKGSIRYPVVMGSLWNKDDQPPWGDNAPAEVDDAGPEGASIGVGDICKDNNAMGGKNHARYFHSRSGHLLLFDDGDNPKVVFKTKAGQTLVINEKEERISIYGSNKEEYLCLDEKGKKITLETKNGDMDLLCKNGTFNLECKDYKIYASASGKLETGTTLEQKSGQTTKTEAGGTMTVEAPLIKLN